MSFVHYLYIGHFEHEGRLVRFANTATDPILKPVVCHSLDMDAVKRLVPQSGREADGGSPPFPPGWSIWAEDGYLACDQGALSPEVIDFIVRLAQVTGCELVDFNTRSSIGPEDLLRAQPDRSRQQIGLTPHAPGGLFRAS
jgi:hypothetical protein